MGFGRGALLWLLEVPLPISALSGRARPPKNTSAPCNISNGANAIGEIVAPARAGIRPLNLMVQATIYEIAVLRFRVTPDRASQGRWMSKMLRFTNFLVFERTP
jgi:hypothetical protein